MKLVVYNALMFGLWLSPAWPQTPLAPAPKIVSPEISSDRRVTFRLAAPKAHEVLLTGEFMQGGKSMEQADNGIWSLTVGPLAPEIYNYNFTIDGVRTIDPGNPEVKSGSTPSTISSILEIRGPVPAFYDGQPVPHGEIRTHWYQSKSLNALRRLTVYTPPGYGRDLQARYPVLYLFHGANADENAWYRLGRVNLILDNLLAAGKVRPFLVVMPFGYGVPPGTPAAPGQNTALFAKDLIEDVIPYIQSQYRVLTDAGDRAIAGLSMGGGESLGIGLNHLELFGYVAGFSSGLGRVADFPKTYASLIADPSVANRKLDLLWIGCGREDGGFATSRSFADFLTGHNVNHIFHESAGAHTWMVWRHYLYEVAPLLFQTNAAEVRAAPVHPVVLRSAQLEVVLDRDFGLPYEYRLSPSRATIHGEASGREVTATVFRSQPHEFAKVTLRPQSVKASPARADFLFAAPMGGQTAATFTLRYELEGAAVYVSLEAVEEKPGFQLIDVGTPDLATVREEDGGGWLAHGDQGGNLIELSKAKPGHLPLNRFWGGVAATLPVVMIGTSKALCVEEVMAFMDTTELAVEGEPGHRSAELGTIAVHRVNGSLPYDMNANPGKPLVAGNEKTPNLLVGQRPVARLDFTADTDGDGVVDWLDGAKIVRARMPEIPTHYYDDKLTYMIHNDTPQAAQPRTTFAQAGELIHKMAWLTAYAPQVAYLWGWQFRGKDTGYPAVNVVNERIGGFEGLEKLIADARTVNATVSFSDNYDDAYRSSPAWDPAIIARQPDGQLWESRAWTGETSHIIGLAKYMAGPGKERVRYTCEHYGLRDTYEVDVLSYYPIRNDWDPEHPASGIKNLTEGRYKVLDEFKKCGLDVISEQLRYAFIGKNSVNGNGPTGGASPFGGEEIPLASAIYRRSAIWGLSGQAWRNAPEIYSLFYNGHEFFGGAETPEHLVDYYYGIMVPWFQVHYRDIESFRRDGDRTVIGLTGNSKIDIDWKNRRYSVTVNGAEIASDGDTFCPLGEDRIAFYSRTGKELSAPLPRNWDANAVAALALYSDHAEEVPVSKSAGRIGVMAPARRPVMVFRDGAAARQRMHVSNWRTQGR